MKSKVLILITGLALLSGCGHLPFGSSKQTAGTPETPQTSSDIEALPMPETGLEDDAEITLEPEVEAPEETMPTIVAPNPAPVVLQKGDLIDRIRDGFRLPDLRSRHTAQYEKWSSQHPSYLKNLFQRAEPFLHHIVEEIEKRDLPMELALLPAIESAYKPNAVSRSGAAGLWQFIPSTGRHFGLRQDWWYDGRRDAIASTDAALDYLTELNQLFDGDWFLALAAYNAGQGTVRKAIRANKRKRRGTRYQDLPLRTETIRYVPKLLALKNILNEPDRFGVTLPRIVDEAKFSNIKLNGQIDIHRFAEQSAIDLPALQHLNAGFRRWATSPEGPYRLLVPVDGAEEARLVVNSAERTPPIDYRSHNIRSGETLSEIGRKYGVSVAALRSTNKLRGSNIRAGKNLLIPISASGASVLKRTGAGSASKIHSDKLVHHVKKGDTLWSIARRYSVRVGDLLSWNKISADQILSLNQAVLVFVN